jgi:hypothetical protein
MSENGWDSLFAQESKKPYWAGLQTFVAGSAHGIGSTRPRTRSSPHYI